MILAMEEAPSTADFKRYQLLTFCHAQKESGMRDDRGVVAAAWLKRSFITACSISKLLELVHYFRDLLRGRCSSCATKMNACHCADTYGGYA